MASGLPLLHGGGAGIGHGRGARLDGPLTDVSAYEALFETLRAALADALAKGSRRLLAAYLQTLLAFPDGCTRGETVLRSRNRRGARAGGTAVGGPKLYPKEKALVDLVASAERMEGRQGVGLRRPIPGTRDITGRMDDILTRHGFRVAVMKADAVAPERREGWVAQTGWRKASTCSSATPGWCRPAST